MHNIPLDILKIHMPLCKIINEISGDIEQIHFNPVNANYKGLNTKYLDVYTIWFNHYYINCLFTIYNTQCLSNFGVKMGICIIPGAIHRIKYPFRVDPPLTNDSFNGILIQTEQSLSDHKKE